METTWRVMQVTEKPGLVLAELQRVEWFKPNPDYEASLDGAPGTSVDEFIDARPGEDGANTIDVGGTMTLDVSGGLDLHPLDNIVMTLSVVTPVEVG